MTLSEINSWQTIKAEVMRRIVERVWLPGDQIPNEVDLAEEFGCARATVNRALREVAEAGLVERRRKAGTRVALNPTRKATLEIPITRLEVEQRGWRWRHVILEREETLPPAVVTTRLGLSDKIPMLHVRTLHYADNSPFLYEDRWVNISAIEAIRSVNFQSIDANEWLVQNAPFTRGDITFSAANATELEAELLEAKKGAAIFVIDRTTWNGDIPVTLVRLAYAPGYRVHTEL
ncbi:GntR family transcriptional regulator [Kiloniella laminariae]|uniref:GntR family transcriptional regulator n=1 Tax=Kiloniella laminariae TaxID=454162 RepID=A0ABT4LJX8_9PROT|nr:GntR family transcriptional regulator [Kiloniella laminariae]MCZ4281409.1 GntR family transcriptional regulator [Kiloniella laminariae]